MDVIVRGEPHEIDFVRRICRDKVRRGVLAILPATYPASDDVVVKLRNERDETNKENERLRERVAELESVTGHEDSAESADAMDDKHIDNDDLHEVDLDADDKTIIEDDSKDVPAVDSKETKTTGKTSKRSKKSE